MVRSFDEEMKFLDKITPTCWKIKKGFVPNMNVCSILSLTGKNTLRNAEWWPRVLCGNLDAECSANYSLFEFRIPQTAKPYVRAAGKCWCYCWC